MSLTSRSIVTGPERIRARSATGNAASARPVNCAHARSMPSRCTCPNRAASVAAVVAAGTGAGSSPSPTASTRSRSKPTRWSSPVSCTTAQASENSPPDSPRSHSLTGPIPASNASVIPSTRSGSATSTTPPFSVSALSGSSTWARRLVQRLPGVREAVRQRDIFFTRQVHFLCEQIKV